MSAPASVRPNPALRLAAIRRIHTWLGVFIAPSILFFAITGGMQLFKLHEAHDGYRPPAAIERLGRLHKDQVFALGHKRPPSAAKPAQAQAAPKAPAAAAHHDEDGGDTISTSALKWLFLLVALGLVTSTCLGLWMALKFGREKRLLWGLLAAGTVLPVLLLLI